ncbi:MAG: alpha/beta hydrolase fold domain-containing protein [Chthoniobacterales bacterium]
MNHNFRSRSLQTLFALCASLIFLSSSAQAGAVEPTEWFANAADGTPLHWVVYTPAGKGPWPVVLVIHGGGFKGGTPTSSPESVSCGRDLAAAGFLALSIEYRLAPQGYLPGQITDGRFPNQSDDVKVAVLAARNDPRGNGQVGAVGGSAGGYQAAFIAGTGTPGQDRIDVGVGLSGAYDLSDFSPDPGLNGFIGIVTNYVGVTQYDTAELQAASPAHLADVDTTPLFLVHSEQDPMPFSQQGDMTSRLDAVGVTNYQAVTLPGWAHAFANWPAIKDQSIAFLAAGFAGVPPVPLPTPTPTATPVPTATPFPSATPSATPSPSPTATPSATPGPSGTPTPPPATAPTPSKVLLNVSTRVGVQSGTSVMIGGFIIAGDLPKQVVLRAIGPSLADAGVTDALSDPVLELYDSAGTLIAQNDNVSSLAPDRIPAGLKPKSGHESLISATLPEGSYTAVLRGANGATGVGLIELYDLDPASSQIINISTRGQVSSGGDAMIGGFIIGGEDPTTVVVRAVGPSLAASKIPNPLPDPLLELYDSNGSLIFSNDNWRSIQADQIIATGLAPTNDREAAIVATLEPGSYTALVRDAAAAEGVALVEVYNLAGN